MPPKTHTFLRQRTLLHQPATPSRAARRVLCFAVHLRFTCSRRGHLYLHRSLHVVFAGTAPDKDAVLETVLEGPRDPVFTPWPRARSTGGRSRAVSPSLSLSERNKGSEQRHMMSSSEQHKGSEQHRMTASSLPSPASSRTAARRRPLPLGNPVPFDLDADGCPRGPPPLLPSPVVVGADVGGSGSVGAVGSIGGAGGIGTLGAETTTPVSPKVVTSPLGFFARERAPVPPSTLAAAHDGSDDRDPYDDALM